jgi:putative heme-binding domain-containing protein
MRTLSLFLLTVAVCTAAVTPPAEINVPAGFKVELLREAGPGEGSWISMAIDDAGRLYISSQDKTPESGFTKDSKWGGMWRATLGESAQSPKADGGGKLSTEHRALSTSAVTKWERVPIPVGDAMGMLWAFDSLYVSGNGSDGRGIYRCKDTDGDGNLDSAVLFKAIPEGSGEHGAHAIILGPDKKLYIVNGNTTPILDGLSPDSPYRNWGEDDLLPRVNDPIATFFDKIKAPYGCVYRTDENGTKWELFAGGFRNPYDIAFNADGELFTYDSDMEWDRGLPWYRPTRLIHVVPGGEYGFREGSAKWPPWYPDSLPAVCDIGVGCPTGMKFGTGARGWPEQYQRALFFIDWTYGRILAAHLHEKGASYTARNDIKSYTYPKEAEANNDVEVFLSGKGMPMTDMEFGKDGALYFTTGGRGTSAALYRVTYVKSDAPPANGASASATDNERVADDLHSGRVGFQPAAPGILPGASDVAGSPQRDTPAPTNSADAHRANERTTTPDGPGRIPGPAGETPALPAHPRLADADAPRGTARTTGAPEAQRKLAGGEASNASVTTGSPTATATAPAGVPELNASLRRMRQLFDSWLLASGSNLDDYEQFSRIADKVSKMPNGKTVIQSDRFLAHQLLRQSTEIFSGWCGTPILTALTSARERKDVEETPEHLRNLLALARSRAGLQPAILEALKSFPLASLSDDLKLLKLRVLELSFARQGRPSEEWVKTGMEKLLAHYPAPANHQSRQGDGVRVESGSAREARALPIRKRATDAPREPNPASAAKNPATGAPVDDPAWRLNRELCQLLVWLSNPELGALNANAPWSAAGSDSATPLSEGKRNGAEQAPTGDKPPTTAPASKSGVALTLATALQGPVPNPGAAIFPGRKPAPFQTELGRQVIEKTLALMIAAPSQEEQVWYALVLRWAHGWTPDQRARYFRWFHEKAAGYTGGNSFTGFLNKIRTEALARCTPEERAALGTLASAPTVKPLVELKPRAFVQAWTMADLESSLGDVGKGRNFARGRELFGQAQCILCHKMGVTGGNVGPDLTAVASRFPRKDILTAILDPNAVVSDQYAMMTFTVRRGEKLQEVSGLLQEDTGGTYTVLTDPLAGTTQAFYHHVVVKKEKALVSIMPPGLLNTLTKEEVLDLLAYLEAGGKADAGNFK